MAWEPAMCLVVESGTVAERVGDGVNECGAAVSVFVDLVAEFG